MRTLLIALFSVLVLGVNAQDKMNRPTSYNYQRGVEAIQKENPEEALEYLKIDHFFSSAVGTNPKSTLSKSDIINIAVDELGLPRNRNVLMIGDSFYDYEGAESSGVDFAAAAYGYGFTETDDIPGSCVAYDVPTMTDFILNY